MHAARTLRRRQLDRSVGFLQVLIIWLGVWEADKANLPDSIPSLKPVSGGAAKAGAQAFAHKQVCAGLFCWTGVLGLAGSCKGLLSECLSRHRSDTVAAANALGLKVRRRACRLRAWQCAWQCACGATCYISQTAAMAFQQTRACVLERHTGRWVSTPWMMSSSVALLKLWGCSAERVGHGIHDGGAVGAGVPGARLCPGSALAAWPPPAAMWPQRPPVRRDLQPHPRPVSLPCLHTVHAGARDSDVISAGAATYGRCPEDCSLGVSGTVAFLYPSLQPRGETIWGPSTAFWIWA